MRSSILTTCALLLVLLAACSTSTSQLVRFDAIYLDMDGTLLDPDAQPRLASLEVIKQFQACGGQVGLATGRTYAQVKELLPMIAPDLPVVLYNGALTAKLDGAIVYVEHVPQEALKAALLAGTESPAVRGIIVHEEVNTYIDREDAKLRDLISHAYIYPDAVIENIANEYKGLAVKVLYVAHEGKTDEVALAISKAVGDRARAIITSPFTVEVVANGVHKAAAIRRVLEARNIDPRNAIYFGDSGNDLEMLSTLGPGFAMGNCRPAACDAAMARIDPNNTDAISDVVRKVVLTPACLEKK
jgi:Cof subfamily protein (haloacid dehalogenase superfamily)